MRNKTTKIALALGMLLLASQAQADQLADIKAAGVVKVATFDANPPFGSVDAKTHHIVGYDVDFAQALAKALGVKLELVATNPANRIPLLQSGKADLIVADITITPERAQVIDFSTPYFVTGQQFLVPAGSPDKLDEYSKARIGAVKGTTGEQALHQRFPQARVLSYDDIPLALTALRNGNVQAITQDSTILAGLLAEAPDKAKFKILPDLLSKEEIGVGVKKGEPALLKAVNDELVKLEKTGEAAKIYDVWFGPATKTPQPRAFTKKRNNMFSGLLSHSAAPAADFSRLQRASITFRDVAKRYGDHQVLNAINLQVEPGEVVAILGPSGSGKSTLIRLINQLESLSGGEILIDGKPTSRLSGSALRQLRSRVGFVFQQFNLYAHLTAQENITLALERVHGWEKSAAQARALALLRQVGLEEKAQQMPAQLSGGQQQRVAIARALASSPQIILFDEPTSALDPEMIGEVLQVMKTLAHSGITMLVVTHEMQFAREIADRVVFIDGGDILEVAPPAEFFAHPQHARARRFLQKVLDPLHQESLE